MASPEPAGPVSMRVAESSSPQVGLKVADHEPVEPVTKLDEVHLASPGCHLVGLLIRTHVVAGDVLVPTRATTSGHRDIGDDAGAAAIAEWS
jgi:hypothetical protein